MSGSRWIDDWRPEDPAFWRDTGRRIAYRNLYTSIFSEHIGFSVWSLWSTLVLFMTPKTHFPFNAGQKFLLVSVVTFVGAALRVPYSMAVARFGGRNWSVVSSLLLVAPTTLALVYMHRPHTSFTLFVVIAAVAGVGGGNFASSMTNINFFYPEREKGRALGLNAGGGNLGVAGVQLVGLLVIAVATVNDPMWVPLVYLVLALTATLCALGFMDNLTGARTDMSAQAAAAKNPHTWIMSVLYIGTFGTFIGFGFGFGLVLQLSFGATALHAAAYTFIGPLAGSLSRPIGGMLADRFGGTRITLMTFVAMALGTLIIIAAQQQHSFGLFVTGFIIVFVLSGVGNGSTYKMIPSIFSTRTAALIRTGVEPSEAVAATGRVTGAALGIVGAVGAAGGGLINVVFRLSYSSRHASPTPALITFLCFYALCVAVTYAVYERSEVGVRGLVPAVSVAGDQTS